MDEYVHLLEGLKGRDFSDPLVRAGLERWLHLAAEAALDAGEMLIARDRLPKPDTYRGILRTLTAAGVLPPDFGARFEGVAALRNLLVHDYTRLDVQRLAAFLMHLDDFRTYARLLAERLRG